MVHSSPIFFSKTEVFSSDCSVLIFLSHATPLIIPITSNVCRDYHQWIFLHGKDPVTGLCSGSSLLWDVCLQFSSPMNGIINLHNSHLWTTRNPHGMVDASHQQWFSINVWAGIVGNCLLGSVLLLQCLNGETYLAFLQNTLPPLLENVPLAV